MTSSLTCAMLLVCVRSRQIPSVLSPFASVISGWEHQLPPPFLLFCRELISLLAICCFIVRARSPRGPHLLGSRLGSWDISPTPKCQPLGGTGPKSHFYCTGERESRNGAPECSYNNLPFCSVSLLLTLCAAGL